MKKILLTATLTLLFLCACTSAPDPATTPTPEATPSVTPVVEITPAPEPTAETINAPPEEYTNEELGFRIEFPSEWKGKYSVIKNPGSWDFEGEVDNSVMINTTSGWCGTLCYIFRETIEEWNEWGRGENSPVAFRLLAENDKFAYVMRFPGDVQWDTENEEQTKEYYDMINDLENVKFYIIES